MSAPRHERTRLPMAMLLAFGLAACATVPPPAVAPAVEDKAPAAVVAVPAEAPLPPAVPVVSQPVLAIEKPPSPPPSPPSVSTPSLPAPAPAEAVTREPPAATEVPVPSPVPSPAPPPARSTPPEPTEEQVVVLLVADLQRYATLSAEDLRRETGASTQALARQRSDANRIRLAVLYTLYRTPQDDQRALQLFDSVTKSANGPMAIRQLAAVLQIQVAERVRAVREEQQKADAAVQKLEALRAMERSLLRDRIRSGGGGGGGGGGSGGN